MITHAAPIHIAMLIKMTIRWLVSIRPIGDIMPKPRHIRQRFQWRA